MIEPDLAARAQLLYRQVNERICAVGSEVFGIPPDEPLSVVCECLEMSCVERIQISVRDLQRARSSPANFVVLPGHEADEVESVVERHAGHLVVAKHPSLIERLQSASEGGVPVGDLDEPGTDLV